MVKSALGPWYLCYLLIPPVAKTAGSSAENVTGHCSHSHLMADIDGSCFTFLFLAIFIGLGAASLWVK